tara:strand:+ start:7836 stop:8453 length:618 start_codon:yes stop_codon:yes gene_type:complete
MNREKFLSFYKNEPEVLRRATECYDAIYKQLATSAVCPTCNQQTTGNVNPLVMLGIMATVRVEAGRDFTPKRENLNYSAQGLLATFPKYFNYAQAQAYARKPEMIANRVYANRMGNGDEASGDGWRHRGANYGQITGKNNWVKCGLTQENCLDIKKGGESIVIFFRENNMIQDCLNKDWRTIRKKYNGGYNGLEEFINVIKQYSN